jgi:hypothetical protein
MSANRSKSFRDYPIRKPGSLVPMNGNVWYTARDERGKRIPKYCRHEHNIWVDLGREYLARVVAPNDTHTDHNQEPPREFIAYMGVGIGGDSQTHPLAYTDPLKTDYPPADPSGAPGGTGNQQTDEDLTVTYLERPVKVNLSSPIWIVPVATPVAFLSASKTVRFDYLYTVDAINTARIPDYPVVPLSECGLFLVTQDPDAANVYDTGNPPTMVGAGRQLVVAYNTFEPIPKTISFSLEIRWELRF